MPRSGTRAVHPHAGGENVGAILCCPVAWRFTPTRVGKTIQAGMKMAHGRGSPPRGWGKRESVTCATRHDAVHPHAGGENVYPPGQVRPDIRFTPTRVGKTSQMSRV